MVIQGACLGAATDMEIRWLWQYSRGVGIASQVHALLAGQHCRVKTSHVRLLPGLCNQ